MDYYDLVKLLYLADREQVRRRGRTITGDYHWSLPWGPVLGHVLDAVRNGDDLDWNEHIRTNRTTKTSTLVQDAPLSALSKADVEVLQSVWEEFGHMDGRSLMRYTHGLPEYTDTDGRVLISLEDIARAVGHSEDEIDQILAQDREREAVERFRMTIEKTNVHA